MVKPRLKREAQTKEDEELTQIRLEWGNDPFWFILLPLLWAVGVSAAWAALFL